MPIGDSLFNIYRAERPLVTFDAKPDKRVPLEHPDWLKNNGKSNDKSMPDKQKPSEMCPV